ncbi:MAG: NUDIX domain-containing protein [Bacteroidetes bacterium]|jgi:8-oxo-dGTP pyrophosphatase MutT (NUDIX family)|nr:NUDIX domain-containing protein [Bacteroidota bacterium]
MYKVFFNDRNVFLTDDFTKYFEVKYGLFYKYKNVSELEELVEFFWNLKSINTLYVFHFDIMKLQEAFKSCFRFVEAAGGIVSDNKGKILIIYRRGKYDLPKGKLDAGESYHQAAIREVQEECGLSELKIQKPLISTYHVYQQEEEFVLKKTYWFDIIYEGNETPTPQAEEDIEQVVWKPLDEVGSILGNTYGSIVDVLRYRKLLPLNITP